MASKTWETVIGLEIHAQLQTKTKMFSPDSASFSSLENEHIHPISLGFPGTLPLFNKEACVFALKTARAFEGNLRQKNVFARKNYFYPDLPKGYQVSQSDQPFCQGGKVKFYSEEGEEEVLLERIHMEEDSGRSLHQSKESLVNLNRAGVPLLEIVTQPVLRRPKQAALCARAIRQILFYLQVCDGSLEEGSLRCDCNISLREKGQSALGTKVELKNLNSFKFIEKALNYEIKRQAALLEKGEKILQETRLYDSKKDQTFAMRSKETSSDYRYFPDPDLLPVDLSAIEKDLDELPELPYEKFKRFGQDYKLKTKAIEVLLEDPDLCDYFEQLAKKTKDPEASCHWLLGEMLGHLKQGDFNLKNQPIPLQALSDLIGFVAKETISISVAKEVFHLMWVNQKTPQEIIKENQLQQISDEKELGKFVQEVLNANPKQVSAYKQGKTKLLGFFVGQVMKMTKGQAHPEKLSKILKDALE